MPQAEFATFPEHRPYAAMDGRLDTSWIASSSLRSDRFVELALARPRPVAAISVYPERDLAGQTDRLGVKVNGGPVDFARRQIHGACAVATVPRNGSRSLLPIQAACYSVCLSLPVR